MEAINSVYTLPGLPLRYVDALDQISRDFHFLNKYTIPRCVGAIDGIAIEITKPTPWDAVYPVQFKNRQGFWSINCKAICDIQLRFTWTSLKSPRGTHDILAWQSSDMFRELEQYGMPPGYYLVGDDAYSAMAWLVTPYPSISERSDFSFCQSRTRITIERAF